MARLGISIYPERSTIQRDISYIRQAAKYGFRRIFTCLLSVGEKSKEELIQEFQTLNDVAHEVGMEVILDVNPSVFDKLGASYENLSVFQQMHADGIRLDEGFSGMKTSMMTYNPEGLKIELNASTEMGMIADVVDHCPNPEKLITCHNFYPQRYTGISLEHFTKCSRFVKQLHLPVAAFVSSNAEGTYGPWPVNEGLCTLEMHRSLPIDLQVRHLFATRLVDDVIIANAYAMEEELKLCAAANPGVLTFGIVLEKELTQTEEKILYYEEKHIIRGDMSEYMIRSTWPRETFRKESIPAANTRDLKRGDVVILNDGYSKYKGELHIVLKEMKNDGRKNVIGYLPEEEQILLDYIEPWKVFAFQMK